MRIPWILLHDNSALQCKYRVHVDINFDACSLPPSSSVRSPLYYAIIAAIIDFGRLSSDLRSGQRNNIIAGCFRASDPLFPMGAEREGSSLSAAKSGREIELTPETGERAEIKIVSELFEAAKGNTTGEGRGREEGRRRTRRITL